MLNGLVFDAKGAFWVMPKYHAHALYMGAAVVIAEEGDVQPVFNAPHD